MQTRIFSVSGGQLNLAGEIYWRTATEMAVTGGVDIAPNANVFSRKQAASDNRSFFWYPTVTANTKGTRNFVVGENAVTQFLMESGGTAYPVVFAYYDNLILKNGATYNATMPGNAFRSDYAASNFIAEGNNVINFTSLRSGNSPIQFASAASSGQERVFYVGPGSEFYSIGDTGSPLINGSNATDAARRVVTIDTPKIFDLRNRSSGTGVGASIATNNLRRFSVLNSDISLWGVSSSLTGPPSYQVGNVTYINQVAGGATTSSNSVIASHFPTARIRRLTGVNQNPTVAFIPATDADKSLSARVTAALIPDESGINEDGETDYIPIYAGEGEAEITVLDSFGNTHTALTNSEGIATVELDNFNLANTEVSVTATRGESSSDNTDRWTIVDVTPPEPATLSEGTNILANTTSIQGNGEPNSLVFFKFNGIEKPSWDTVINNEGEWEVDVSSESLHVGDTIQVFLQDSAGEALGIPEPPSTNNMAGNINPAETINYRDAIFEKATIITVVNPSAVEPVDPINPEIEINPENKPELPENQGLLSIDFVSQFNFGEQAISANNKIYFARPQRILNEDGSVNMIEERPNYIQISDRRGDNGKNGWELSVTQVNQFRNINAQELEGAQLNMENQQLVSVQGGSPPLIIEEDILHLIPGSRHILLLSQESEGMGTWIYRFGNNITSGESISLEVPKGANPDATTYSTNLSWELNAVPLNLIQSKL